MARDYRSDKMPTYEGHGKARRAWEAYARGVNRVVPASWGEGLAKAATPAAEYVAREVVQANLGFWLLWHLAGGFDGLREYGMSRSTIYKKISRFRSMTGEHPDEFELPGVSIDYEAYWAGVAEESAKGGRRVRI